MGRRQLTPVIDVADADDFSVTVGEPKLSIHMGDAMIVRGYFLSVDRLRDAKEGLDAGIALVEVLTWFDVICSRWTQVNSVQPASAVRYVRGRCHHQAAFAIYRDRESGDWMWHPGNVLPTADPGYARPKEEQAYERQLAGRRVLETLAPFEAAIRRLAPPSESP